MYSTHIAAVVAMNNLLTELKNHSGGELKEVLKSFVTLTKLETWPGSDSKGFCYIAFACFCFSVVPGNSPVSIARLFNN